MSFQVLGGNLGFTFSAFGTVVLAVLMLLLGSAIKRRSGFCQRYCIPAPVIGGVFFALANLLFHVTGCISITLDNTYQNDMQFMFFTIVGFGASFRLLRRGGKKLVVYFLLTGLLIILQAGVGILGATITGISPIYGIICGPAPLAGGHGSVAAYGEMLEGLGHSGAMVAGMAAATFGLIAGSFLGGPICERLVRRDKLQTPGPGGATQAQHTAIEPDETEQAPTNEVSVQSMFFHLALIGGFMVIGGIVGTYLGKGLSALTGGNISLPGFCGPMLVAFLVCNLNDHFRWFRVNDRVLHGMEELSLGIFLSMAMISLELWQLVDLAIPMLVILFMELVMIVAYLYFVVFRCMGRDYEAAACCAGLCGHGFGATPNGIANLGSVSERFGYPTLAFLIVPIVGGFLQDIFLVPVCVMLINLFG